MTASLYYALLDDALRFVTKSVTNLLGSPGQSRATVTNFVTKLRAIQGNEIAYFG